MVETPLKLKKMNENDRFAKFRIKGRYVSLNSAARLERL